MAPVTATELDSAQRLTAALLAESPELQQAKRLLIACSGGLDSIVLLHHVAILHRQGALPIPVLVIHINHALQAAADSWQLFCQTCCEGLGLRFHSERVQVELGAGASPEDAARRARHAAFDRLVQQDDILLLAQHLDDQVETVLFRLLRGSGVAGLAGMPRSRPCGKGLLLRPLLGLRRATLLAYAQEAGLQWCDDQSNQDQRFDRNYLRATVVPALERRWPGMAETVSRSARLCSEAAQLLDDQGAADLQIAVGNSAGELRIAPIADWPEQRLRNLLRYWLQALHEHSGLALPTHQVLHAIVNDVIPSANDAMPELHWGKGDAEVFLRRFRNSLYALRPMPALPDPLQWNTAEALVLPPSLGSLHMLPCTGPGLPLASVQQIEVRFRSGGEKFKPANRPTRALKKFLQEHAVPPWMRECIPLLYVGDELVAVGDLGISEVWLDKSGENCVRPVWQRSILDCGY